FFSSRRRHTRSKRDWSSDVCSSDLGGYVGFKSDGVGKPERNGGKPRCRFRNTARRKGRGRSQRRGRRERRKGRQRRKGRGRSQRSEERRVGKECRSRRAPEQRGETR